MGAFLRAFGAYLPDTVITNDELAPRCGCEAAWIHNVSGILERRVAGADETTATMGVRAAEDCLARANRPASDIGLIICASGTMERRFPGPGAEIGQKLGIGGVPVIDLPMASAGSLFGLALAAQLTAVYGNVLVVASEKMTQFVHIEMDRNTAILFGDGAGAALVTTEGGPGAAEIVDSALHSDGSFVEALKLDQGADMSLFMNGPIVIMHAARKIPAGILEVLGRNQVAGADVQIFLMHQANGNLIARVAKSVGVGPEKFYINIERYGNTSSASMLIAATDWSRETGGFQPGAPVIFAGFGAGFHWGALLARGV